MTVKEPSGRAMAAALPQTEMEPTGGDADELYGRPGGMGKDQEGGYQKDGAHAG